MKRCLTVILCALFLAQACAHGEGEIMPRADISNPFQMGEDGFWGYCVAQGALSDLPVDLDGDGVDERLVVYFAPTQRAVDDDAGDEWRFACAKDLRLAVYQMADGAYANVADIVIDSYMGFSYANIHVSVWGEGQKAIYVRNVATYYDGTCATYAVLRFRDGALKAQLVLKDPGYTDDWGLFQLDITDPAQLCDTSYAEGAPLDVSFRPFPGSDDDAEPEILDCETYYTYEAVAQNANYASVLKEKLSPWGIDDNKDTDPAHCVPVCEIRFYLNAFDTFADPVRPPVPTFKMVDYTRQ